MNAPETHITEPINAAHTVLIQATEALCIDQVAKAAGVGKSAATKQLKALSDLGLLEAEFRTGGTPYYFLAVAQPAAVTTKPTKEVDRILTPEAKAELDDFEAEYGYEGNCSCHISAPCSSCLHPGNPRNQEEDESCWMDAPAEGSEIQPTSEQIQPTSAEMQVSSGGIDWAEPEMMFLAPEDYELPPADPELLAMANRELGEQVAKLEEQLSAAAADVVRTRQALTNAINEADRLRAELAAERQASEALQQQSNAAPINARGYVVTANNREPTFHLKFNSARKVAESVAKKSGQAYMDALVPVGSVRMAQCVEWRNAA